MIKIYTALSGLAIKSDATALVCAQAKKFSQAILILCLALLPPSLVHAASSGHDLMFETSGQGVWGPEVDPQFLNDYFIGISDGRLGQDGTPENDLWDFELPLHPVVPIYGTSSGRIGLELNLNVDAGSVDFTLPYEDAGVSFSYAAFSSEPSAPPVKFTTIATLSDDAFMRTYSPDLSFGANFVFETTAGIRGGGCVDLFFVSGCGSFNESFTIPKQELVLLDIGPDESGAIQVEVLPALQALYDNGVAFLDTANSAVEFGGDVKDAVEDFARDWNEDGTPATPLDRIEAAVENFLSPPSFGAVSEPLVEAGFKLPQIANTGGKVTIEGVDVVQTTVASDIFLEIDVDVDGLAAAAFGLPLPLSFEASLEVGPAEVGLDVTLADLTLNTDFIASQQITITPTLTVDLALECADGSIVMAGTDAGSLLATNSLPGLDIGQDFFVDWEGSAMQGVGGLGPLLITPTYHLSALLSNDTDVGFDIRLQLEVLFGQIILEVFAIDVFDVEFGPLFDETLPLAGGDLFTLPGGAFEVFTASFMGDVITLFPADATFEGGGANTNWSNPVNWADDVGDDGNSVVINDGLNVQVNSGDDFEVSNLDIGAGSRLRVVGSGALWQADGANSRAFTNEGRIEVYSGGKLGIFGEVNGGGAPSEGLVTFGCQGCIFLIGGKINGFTAADGTMVEGPIDLNGQVIVGVGEINATGQFDVDANSLVQSGGALTLNVEDVITSFNQGRISVAGAASTLDWRSSHSGFLYNIDNTDGVIEAITGGKLILSHQGPNSLADGVVTITGGELRTDANASSVIEARSLLRLDNLTNNAKIDAQEDFALKNTVINNGEITAQKLMILFDGDTEISGDGELKIGARIIAGIAGTRFTNGAGHTISGTGDIGVFGQALSLDNHGTVSATGGTLRIENDADFFPSINPNVNRGTLEAGAGGTLELGAGVYDMTGQDADMNRLSLVHARGGDVVLDTFAETVNGATTGPGGIWKASGGNSISLDNGAMQWASLAADIAVLDGGEIVLNGAGSDFIIDGNSLDETLDRIGSDGKLTLINHTFQRGGFGIPLILNESEFVSIAGHLELVNGSFITDDSNVLVSNAGFVRVNTGGVISGYGKVKSDKLENFGTIIAEGVGKTLQLDGSISGGSGDFIVTDGAKLSLDLGQCEILGIGCSFVRSGSAGPELSGNGFKVESITADSELVLWGLDDNVLIETLKNTTVELKGTGARLKMFGQSCVFLDLGCSTTSVNTLNQTLELIDSSDLILAGGKVFNAFQNVTVANGGTLTLKDSDTAYTGPVLSLTLGSSVDMKGGALMVNSLFLASDTLLEGYGTVVAATITNGTGFGGPGTGIRANDGLLEIRNSTIVQDTGGPFGTLEATAIDLTATERDANSVLRLLDTTVIGGNVIVGQGAMLDGNGSFGPNVNVSNNGTIRIDTIGAGPATYFQTTVTNESKSRLLVMGAKLRLENTLVNNNTRIDTVVDPDTGVSTDIERRASIQVLSELTYPGDSILELSNSFVTGGDLVLRSQAPSTVDDPQAILQGFGTLNDINLSVGTNSLVDANVAGQSLTFNIGTGSITTVGTMQASNGGSLNLNGGTVAGSGDLLALDNSTVLLTNVNLDGIGFDSFGTGKIVDVAQSTFTNLSNGGTFEIASTGHAILAGNVNNRVEESDGSFREGTIRVVSGGTLELAPGTGTVLEEQTQTIAGDDGDPDTVDDMFVETVFVPIGTEPIPFSLSHGTLVVEAGATIIGNGSVLQLSEAILTGNGIIDADAFLDGTLQPGASPGLLEFLGDATFGENNTLEIELGGLNRITEYDGVDVGGTLTMAGTLELIRFDLGLGDGLFNPSLGNSFDILNAALFLGSFDNIILPGLDAGLLWDTSSLGIDGVISVAAVPLPPAVWMFLTAVAGLMSVGRRARNK